MTDYIAADDLRAFIKDPGQLNQSEFDNACTVASRKVEELCGRTFFADSVATARYFWADNYRHCRVDDISSTSGLLVAVDSNNDGTYAQTWTINTDFVLEPRNQRRSGIPWPYVELRATLASKSFLIALNMMYEPVRVTAKWGWAAVPDAVVQATKILAHYELAVSGAPLGMNGMDGWGPVRVKGVPETALELLRPYMLDEYAVA